MKNKETKVSIIQLRGVVRGSQGSQNPGVALHGRQQWDPYGLPALLTCVATLRLAGIATSCHCNYVRVRLRGQQFVPGGGGHKTELCYWLKYTNFDWIMPIPSSHDKYTQRKVIISKLHYRMILFSGGICIDETFKICSQAVSCCIYIVIRPKLLRV